MGNPIFIENTVDYGTPSIPFGGVIASGSSLLNMLDSTSRITKISMNNSGCRVTIPFTSAQSINSIVLPRIRSNASLFRIFGYANASGVGSSIIYSGQIPFDRFNQGPDAKNWYSNWHINSTDQTCGSIVLYFYGFSGAQIEIRNIIAGNALQLDRCPQEPTIAQSQGGSMAATVSGLPATKEAFINARVISVPFASISENDRITLFDFESRNMNKPFFASLWPDEQSYRGQQYSMLARFKSGLSYTRRRRTVNHQTAAVLIEA